MKKASLRAKILLSVSTLALFFELHRLQLELRAEPPSFPSHL
jgi:hypothetical protein